MQTTSATPFFFNFHHGDLGNFSVIGPSGSGKTVVMNFLAAQAQKFSPRTILFDKDRGGEVFLPASAAPTAGSQWGMGALVTSRIALAVLLALGPIFVVLALFPRTRGLTAGWLRGLVLTAIAPLFVVLGGGLMIELLVPVVAELGNGGANGGGGVDGRADLALFPIAAVHVSLMGMVMEVADTIVAGWQVFGLGAPDRSSGGNPANDSDPREHQGAEITDLATRNVLPTVTQRKPGGDGIGIAAGLVFVALLGGVTLWSMNAGRLEDRKVAPPQAITPPAGALAAPPQQSVLAQPPQSATALAPAGNPHASPADFHRSTAMPAW